MNKTASCIKIIQILSTRNDFVSSDELAEILETNQRNIREYVKEICVAGYDIESRKGVYGGYRMKQNSSLPLKNITSEDKKVLQKGLNILSNDESFIEYGKYSDIMGNILSSIEAKDELSPLTMMDKFPLSIDKSQLQNIYQTLSDAIELQLKCEITYTASNNQTKVHTIHPYKLYMYNGAWFVLAFNELINDFGYFKLNRIDAIIKTKNYFTIVKNFELSNYLDEFGMKKNGEYYEIQLEFSNMNTIIKERIYGKNQKIEEIDSEHVILRCEMQNKEMIKSFVLSYGEKCRVISPEWLIDDIKLELWKCLSIYEE
ncbi:MAG: helix-turn-helix transcriptional regulator [Anaeroplasma sp.]